MSAEILSIVLRTTLAASAAIVLVLLMRKPARQAFGAQVGYALWLLVPAALIATFIPARVVFVQPPPLAAGGDIDVETTVDHAIARTADAGDFGAIQILRDQWGTFDLMPLLLGLWLAGVAVSVFMLLRNHRRAMRNADAGPAVVGILRPHIVLPRDFEERYSPAERNLVLAHERAHLASFDAQINAFAALLHCLNWFNPLFAVARKALHIDQELACDARVMSRHGESKRTYAEAMLKAQLSAQPAPLACQWPPTGAGPLKQRIAMLARPHPSPSRTRLGALLCTLALSGAVAVAWIAQPPRLAYADNGQTRIVSDALGRQLVSVMTEGNMRDARDLIAAGADVNTFVAGDGTPLVIAARFGDRDMVELLLTLGADVNQSAPGDGNPLIMASAFGHLDVAQLLVEHGGDVNGIVRGDETPLINAARENHLDVARYLIDRGADVNLAVDAPTVRGMERRSPLSMAIRGGHDDMVRLLRARGATG